MIHIKRARLPESLQAFARRENGAVVVYVSATLPAGQRTAAIRRALRAAPEAGWRSPRSPVVLPALAGGAGLPLAPEGRWTYRALFAAAVAGVAAVIAVVTALALTGGSPSHGGAGSPAALRHAASPTGRGPIHAIGPSPGTGAPAGPGASAGPGPAPGKPGTRPKAGQPGAVGSEPAPETSGRPAPVPTVTAGPSPRPFLTATPSPAPTPSPSPAPKKSAGSGCVDLLGVKICL